MTEGRARRLGDVLREAREAKGADLTRVERDTKIRERYLSALERGDYRELPGSVYTKGFLRNYGAYLGLDPEELIDLYRLETTAAADRPRVQAPRPLAGRRSRAFVVTPGAIVAAILTIGVGAFIAYLAFEIINFARTPELRITEPPGNVTGYTDDEITIRGITAPNARIEVDNLRENPRVEADASGAFEVSVGLVPGSNVVRLTATDPVTNRASAVEERTIIVASDVGASPTPVAALTLDEPTADAEVTGEVAVRGTGPPNGSVELTATLLEAAPLGVRIVDPSGAEVEVEPGEPRAPEPQTVETDASGAFAGTLRLAPGRWEVTASADGAEPVTRAVTVRPGAGVAATLRVDDGESYMELEEDGQPIDESRSILADGDRVELRAEDELRIRAGNAAVVRITIDGRDLGPMGEPGQVVEWRITRGGD